MSHGARGRPPNSAVLAAISILIGVLVPVGLAEIVLRFLPVSGGLMAAAVNEKSPVFHFTPNRSVTWSRDWNFSIVNRIRVNNAGYVNDQDYDAADPRPLCAVVGDSYVEASMVPYAETLHGRLAKAFAPQARVYSFAASGAPLSQYVIWAREARERWQARALAIVVVANDWDESLAVYKVGPGFHHYVEGPGGSLVLNRFDHQPSWWRQAVRSSALGRYLFFNLQVQDRLHIGSPAQTQQYVGNTPAAADRERLDRSKTATRAFLRDLVAVAGWSPDRVVFIVDGIRYPTSSPLVLGSYFVQMRTSFMVEARAAGFEVVDMDVHFFAKFRAERKRFDFPSDGHWNGLGHAVVAEALAATATFSKVRPGRDAPSQIATFRGLLKTGREGARAWAAGPDAAASRWTPPDRGASAGSPCRRAGRSAPSA